MKVTEIEVHEISLEYQDWIAYPVSHYQGVTRRTVYVAHTDTGLIGLGESGRTEPQEVINQYLGSNPFEWMGDEVSIGLGTAMYDLMGQAAGVAGVQALRAEVPLVGTGGQLDRVERSQPHGRGRGELRRPGLHLAQVPPVAL